MIECMICNKQFKVITNTHLRTHNITENEYRKKFGNNFWSNDSIQQKSKYKIVWDKQPLGKVPDKILANKLKVPLSIVKSHRKKRKIKSFNGKYETQEGFICRSIYEAMYDAFLHSKNIIHKHEVLVPKLNYIADFLVKDTYIEIEGMVGYDKYEKRCNEKKKGYKKYNYISPVFRF